MDSRASIAFSLLLSLAAISPVDAGQARPPGALTIVSVGPQGEVATLAEANEIRVVFSEPMVTLGRIPEPVRAPFFQLTPAAPGTFRWSGTTILIFTPDPKRPLPYATRFEVTIDTTATAVSGRRLAQPARFTFTTPTVRLLNASWARRDGRYSGAFQAMLRFNQPVRPADILAHLSARFEPHDWDETWVSSLESSIRARAPQSLPAFTSKVAATRAAASATTPVQFAIATDWDKVSHPPSSDLVVLEARTNVPPQSWIRLQFDERLPSPAGAAVPAAARTVRLEAEPAFFVTSFHCAGRCDPDGRNALQMTREVHVNDFAAATSAADITGARRQTLQKTGKPRTASAYGHIEDSLFAFSLEDAGFAVQPPATTYEVRIDGKLQALDGQTLGYTWVDAVDNAHRFAFTSFGDGHGVWEKGGGATLPFYARNMQTVRQWAQPIAPAQLMPTIREETPSLSERDGVNRRLNVTPDRVQSHGFDISSALTPSGTGLLRAAIREGDAIPNAAHSGSSDRARTRSSIVQVTNLGISVKDSPQNTLIFVTRLDTAAPVSGAAVSIVRLDNSVYWRGTTGADGVAIAPNTPLRDENWWQFAFIVMAEKDGDVAYVGSDWNEGVQPWEFGANYNLNEAEPLLRGTVFTDRGVYRLGEEVHFKAVLRHNAPNGIHLLPSGSPILISIRDTQDRLVDERVVRVNDWSSAEWTMTLPADGTLGNYSIRAIRESDRPKPKAPEERRPWEEASPRGDDYVPYQKTVHGSFLVAAYRRPDFRVDVTLSSATAIAGEPLKGNVSAKYLFGAAMGPRPVTWRYSKSTGWGAPAAVTEKFPEDRWIFVGWDPRDNRVFGDIQREETTLGPAGELPLTLETTRAAGVPFVYALEADVEDVSRQHIANRANVTVHPAAWYIGVRRPAYFIDQKAGLKTEIVAVKNGGGTAAGVPIEIALTQVQWQSVRRAEGGGFYTWETERRLIPSGSWNVTTAHEPVPLEIPFENGGYYILEVKGLDESGRFAVTTFSFYVLGNGYTAWTRFDHNRIELVPEKKTYRPGDMARIMIQSPWEQATALVTTEREGIRSHRQFALTSTQQSITVPITEADIPNVFVSVLLVKGRTDAAATPEAVAAAESEGGDLPIAAADPSDPGKPSFRLGYVELQVEDRTKRLTVAVTANKQEYRPANSAKVDVLVRDHEGRGTASEVTLWAVDYGVLSLTAFRTPDVLKSVYVEKALQVMNTDNRQRIISRRVLTPKGATDGGGGGADSGAGTMRKDFRVLAFWLGSVTTNAQGRASVDVKLPESLTTYRIMAVAADRVSRFGAADSEIRINKPITMKPTFPRFLAVGDKALFGAVVTSQLASSGSAVVTIKSLDPDVLAIAPNAQQTLPIAAGGSVEARFEAAGRSIGRARVQMTVKVGRETDAFEDVIPVEILASPETVAAYGEVSVESTNASEALTIPSGVVPGFGGLKVELSSTAMVGLGEGARYLVEYPYGCAEQKGSRALALLLAADLGDAFTLPGMDTAKMRPAVQQTLTELERFQCPSGGFAYWPGACSSVSPYLTAYLLNVFKTAVDLKYTVDPRVQARAYTYLERELAQTPPEDEGWWPAYTAWQTFAVKVLAEGGRNQDSNITRLFGYLDRMPVFAHAYLHDALIAKKETSGARVAELQRRMSNAILPEGGSAHIEELSDEYLLWFWNSNVRSTAIVLNTLVKAGVKDAPVRQLVRWMMAVRKNGRWGNTQENAHAMQALVSYYRVYESVTPDFRATVTLGTTELAQGAFKGRSTDSTTKDVPMARVLVAGAAGSAQTLTFSREGTGTLFYTTRLRYAADELHQQGLDAGINVERRYEPYIEGSARPAATSFAAGDLVRVTLTFRLTKERRFVAVTDPLPAGFEAVESWFATTARDLAEAQDEQPQLSARWWRWWQIGGFDRVERHDDRVQLFATRLSEGVHEFTYIARATTAGTFRTAPAHAEEMYEPEVFGRTATAVIEVRK